jgi:hypothetical protein
MKDIIIEDQPVLYEKLKPYIEYMESVGFYTDHDMKYFTAHNEDNYEYFNNWKYNVDGDAQWVVDLALSTFEPKIEIYTWKIKKYKKDEPRSMKYKDVPFDMHNKMKRDGFGDYAYESKLVDNINDFKKEIGKYLKTVKKFKERIKLYEMEKDFK